jgi:hypothetical protein
LAGAQATMTHASSANKSVPQLRGQAAMGLSLRNLRAKP